MESQGEEKRARLGPTQKALGQRIRTLRKQSGLSQEELADRAGVHWSYLARLERGELNPTLRNLLAVATGLGVPLLEVFRFETQDTSKDDRAGRGRPKRSRST
jgi:transcriptional regulator with XRE-family HTH domain